YGVTISEDGTINLYTCDRVVRSYPSEGQYRRSYFDSFGIVRKGKPNALGFSSDMLGARVGMESADDRTVLSVTLIDKDGKECYVNRTGERSWQFVDNKLLYDWRGDISVVVRDNVVVSLELYSVLGRQAFYLPHDEAAKVVEGIRACVGKHVGIS